MHMGVMGIELDPFTSRSQPSMCTDEFTSLVLGGCFTYYLLYSLVEPRCSFDEWLVVVWPC